MTNRPTHTTPQPVRRGASLLVAGGLVVLLASALVAYTLVDWFPVLLSVQALPGWIAIFLASTLVIWIVREQIYDRPSANMTNHHELIDELSQAAENDGFLDGEGMSHAFLNENEDIFFSADNDDTDNTESFPFTPAQRGTRQQDSAQP